MLKHLYIKDFTLIDTLDIDFDSGFSVITGETGAGKSIILGAIGLLLGQRADTKSIKSGCKRCIIEAHFNLSKYGMEPFFEEHDIDFDADDCIIRREVSSSGKSRAFINDTPVPLTTMRELGEQLVDVHSQHQNLLINKEDFQLNVVDIIAGDRPLVIEYRKQYDAYKNAVQKLEHLKESIAKAKEDEDFMRFQYQELEKVQLKEGEQEQMEQDSETMSHSEDIKTALYQANAAMNGENGEGVLDLLKSVTNSLSAILKVYPEIQELAERADSSYIELKDIAQELENKAENVDFNPAELEAINARLDTIYSLQQKFHVNTVEELLTVQTEIAEKLSHIDNSDEELRQLETEVEEKFKVCQKQGEALTKARQKSARKVEQEMLKRLVPLGIPNVRFSVSIEPKPLSTNGGDKVSFLFSANTSTAMQPVSQVASGGEIARVMLSLKAMISGAVKLPTIIFDEIDTGVSGKIAEKMAHIMQEMGDNGRQVISITHLPQIAALGKHHYKVYKEESEQGTISHMDHLSTDERVVEIAQMLSGSDVTEAAINNAKALLNQ